MKKSSPNSPLKSPKSPFKSSMNPLESRIKTSSDFKNSNLLHDYQMHSFPDSPSLQRKNNSLEEVLYLDIKQKAKEIDTLQEKLRVLEEEGNSRWDREKTKLTQQYEEKINNLQKKLEGKKNKVSQIQEESQKTNAILKEEIMSLQSQIEEKEQNFQTSKKENQNLIAARENAFQEELESKNKMMEEMHKAFEAEKTELNSQMVELKNSYENEKNSQSKLILDLQAKLKNEMQVKAQIEKDLAQTSKLLKDKNSELEENNKKLKESQILFIKKEKEFNDLTDSIVAQREAKAKRQLEENFMKLSKNPQKMNFNDFTAIQSQAASYMQLVTQDEQKKSDDAMSIIQQNFMTKKISFSELSNEFNVFLLDNYFKYLNVSMVLKEKINPEMGAMLTHMLSVCDMQKNYINLELDIEEYRKKYCNDMECEDCKKKFTISFIEEMSNVLNVPKGDIFVHNYTLDNNKLNVSFDISNQVGLTPEQQKRIEENKANKALSGILKNCKDMKVQQLFSMFQISYTMLDPKGNNDFTNWKDEKAYRGGMVYYFPKGTKRIGLNVSKKYDNGDDTWLGMENKEGEWAVSFHGTAKNDAVANISKSSQYKIGIRQLYEKEIDENTGKPCGRGIYSGQSYDIVKTDYSADGFGVNTSNGVEKYRIAFQNRINPKTVRIPVKKKEYYIINDPKDIRPYGILIEKL